MSKQLVTSSFVLFSEASSTVSVVLFSKHPHESPTQSSQCRIWQRHQHCQEKILPSSFFIPRLSQYFQLHFFLTNLHTRIFDVIYGSIIHRVGTSFFIPSSKASSIYSVELFSHHPHESPPKTLQYHLWQHHTHSQSKLLPFSSNASPIFCYLLYTCILAYLHT